MAIVATLTEAANRHTPSANSIASIPLNKLVLWDGNVRKTGATDGLEQLIANIAAHGVLQSLVVRKINRGNSLSSTRAQALPVAVVTCRIGRYRSTTLPSPAG